MDIKDIRPIRIEEHPVSSKTYLIPTYSIGETYAMVLKAIKRLDSGLVIYGRVRYGKTRAMLYCRQCLSIDFPSIPVAIFFAERDLSPSKGGFYTSLLEVVGHAKWEDHCSISIKKSRLKNFIIDAAFNDPRRIYILFIDEASRLLPIHYDWIKDLYNALMEKSVTLLPILVGQSQLLGHKETFLKAGEEGEAIVNRFLLYEHSFRGIRDKEDFVECLGYYDSAVFPEGSNWPYTRFFFPEAFAAGLRLQDYGDMLWDAFKESYKGLGIKADMEIPMKYFTKTIEILLTEYSESDSASFSLSPAVCMSLIEESWFAVATRNSKIANTLA